MRSGTRVFAGGNRAVKRDGVYSEFAVAARVRVGAVFPGGGAGGNLGRAVGVAGAVLSGTGLFTTRTNRYASGAAVSDAFVVWPFEQTERGSCERSTGSTRTPDV
jgi:hypothetical protein